jgi:ABC-type dipeptide/oligopeptide/nickel transport system permease component
MAFYLLKRVLLIIPTLFGIMLFSFVIIQFAPGGPVEQMIAQLMGHSSSIVSRMGGGGGDALGGGAGGAQLGQGAADSITSKYRGAQGLDPAFIKSLEKQFGFDKPAPERFYLMMKNFLTFDFGKSYFRDVPVMDLIKEKLPVSISLGLWMTLLTYLISIPLGIRKAVRDGEPFDTWSSAVLVVGYAIPGFLFAVLLLILFAGSSFVQWFPSRGLFSDNWDQLSMFGKITDYAADDGDGGRFVHGDDVSDEELVSGRNSQAVRRGGAGQRAVGAASLVRTRLPQRHAADHLRLPGRVHQRLLFRGIADRNDFFTRWARPPLVRKHREARLSCRVRVSLHLFADRPGRRHHIGLRLHPRRSAHRLRDA